MLMLQRASGLEADDSECDDPMVTLVCNADPENALCPEACRPSEEDEPEEPTVVKAGDLVVTAEAAANRKVLRGGTSDLDTITFKSSEALTLNKVTLERYGYSTAENVEEVQLEDQEGNVIAEAKGLTKDKVTLSLKKDYRTVDGTYEATIVVKTTKVTSGSTLGFKVIDVDSTAENENLKDYTANTYDIVDYAGATVYVAVKGSAKDYNYVEGDSYEVARLKITAGSNDIYVKGFTLTNASGLDMAEFLDELTVTANSEEVNAKYSVNKDDELVVSFDEIEVAANKNVTFILNASFAEFDDYGEAVAYYVAESADVNIIEKKNDTRVNVDLTAAEKADAIVHTFNGGKIKLSNTKLGNVDAAQASEGIVIAEGKVTITEPISKMNFDIVANENAQYIDTLTFVINGEEYEGTVVTFGACNIANHYYAKGDRCIDSNEQYIVSSAGTGTAASYSKNSDVVFHFKNVAIEKSGKAQFKVDMKDVAVSGTPVINFVSSLNRDAFAGARYDSTNKDVLIGDVAGSISFAKVTMQAAKASLENNLTKDVEFLANETSTKVVFDGTYTAKKGDVYLNKVKVVSSTENFLNNKVTFYVTIDGEEVAQADANIEETFSNVKVALGDKVSVKVEAEVEAYGNIGTLPTFTLELRGEDVNGNEDTGKGSDTFVTMKVKESGTVKVEAGATKNTVLLRGANQTFAKFSVKPSNASDEDLYLDNLVLDFSASDAVVNSGAIRVKVAGTEIDAVEDDENGVISYEPVEPIKSGVEVEVIFKDAVSGEYNLVVSANGKTREFNRAYQSALVYVTSQTDEKSYTKFTLGVDKYDDDYTISEFKLFTGYTSAGLCDTATELDLNGSINLNDVTDEDTFEINNAADSQVIACMSYTIKGDDLPAAGEKVVVTRGSFSDYFTVNGSSWRVSAKD